MEKRTAFPPRDERSQTTSKLAFPQVISNISQYYGKLNGKKMSATRSYLYNIVYMTHTFHSNDAPLQDQKTH